MTMLIRLLEFAQRFLVGITNWSFADAIKVFWVYRKKTVSNPISIFLKNPGRKFFFRGAADRGVISHFYKAGYRIREGENAPRIKTIIDAGAHIGDETVRFRHFHPEATIIALEADKDNFALLQKNFEHQPNTFIMHRGLWSHECRLKVIPGTVNESFRVEEVQSPDQPYDISAISIPGLLKEFKLSEIDILKMDIEGAEKQIFSAPNLDWIALTKVLIFECPDYDSPETTMLIFKRLLEHGLTYNVYIHGECLVLIRADTPWHLVSDLFLER